MSQQNLLKRNGIYFEKFKDIPFTGKVIGKKQGKIVKGIKHGEWKDYWENGQLREKRFYEKQNNCY